ncbi:D-alanyl-D-alanine carboxypeptidase [Streptomyces albireticuli]|uniref:D-alanyl-D-alanine carboxypeptidase n=2 Tax=Streptomyces albireticuli TaxID=1940 RepID=A0A2A2D4C8_9ACTN|nr:D-alanyl-D-alanine carboxypeptidase [Streptomyces albireticuli]MCD9142818.1 D-alanyl-D-alanine carboxypeptidase [Streptomyces albireticuli]MCD9162863.1 D-alanyl-D-alanine carboxypeptidase [Streptomyces albireticuli]MCD9192423.1 D-alanyl-D-alanine carboxypeptidase [Streptomyces albireticuli]PAU46365.1 D-alanyl-D-alanine carboxypeptidase [Streptomyces albireticuli]
MNQLHTPKASRNQDTGRERTAARPDGRGAGEASPEELSMGFSMRSASRTGPIGSSARVRPGEAATRGYGRRGTFTDVPTTTSHRPRSAAAGRCGAALAATASLLLPLMTAAPAHADNPADGKGAPKVPPAQMSTVGGELLGKPGPQVRRGPGAPQLPKDLSGRSWLVADAESGEILAANNAHWRLPPASTLKMLFADTVLPKLPRNQTHKVVPSDLEGMGAGSSAVGVKEGSSYSVHDLWLGVFLRSGNDAVRVLSAMNGGVPRTVKDMQAHAEDLQAKDTHVVTPDGYDADGQVSSAYDLTLFARSGLQKADFREYCATVSAKFPGEEKPGKKRDSFAIVNTNRLLTGEGMPKGEPYKGMAGVKNGSTTNAGNTFTGVAQHDGRKLLVTVMNPETAEPHRVYTEARALLDWGFEAAGHVQPVGVLVPPRGAADKPGDGRADQATQHAQASVAGAGGGMWTAVGIAGAALVVLAAGGFVVHRRHPLPDRMRRRG